MSWWKAGIAGLVAICMGQSIYILQRYYHKSKRKHVARGIGEVIGSTPMIRIASVSDATGCDIFAKAEFMNPGGSTKDRVAKAIIQDALHRGVLTEHPKSMIFEGTVGSTGISLAMLARAYGIQCYIVMPDDQAKEKYAILERLGAVVERVRPASIVLEEQFVNVARKRAKEYDAKMTEAWESGGQVGVCPRGYFCDQFENTVNAKVHFDTTGPEIWKQLGGEVDAFVCGAGTGGTLAGVSRYLKSKTADVHVVLADPTGSGLYNRVMHGVLYSREEAEGTRRRHQVDTVVEGIGLNRMTRNLALILEDETCTSNVVTRLKESDRNESMWIDWAEKITDQEAVWMARWLAYNDGIFIGSSSAVNVAAAVRVARKMGPGARIATLLCDSGQRHLTKFWYLLSTTRATI